MEKYNIIYYRLPGEATYTIRVQNVYTYEYETFADGNTSMWAYPEFIDSVLDIVKNTYVNSTKVEIKY